MQQLVVLCHEQPNQNTCTLRCAALPVPVPTRRVWLYSLVPADYDGAAVLPHWLKHYLGLGIDRSNILLLVNHNPEK